MQSGAQISTSTLGQGLAGNIELTANRATLNNAQMQSATLLGQGGNITFGISDSLTFDNSSQVSASTVNGQGGAVIVNATGPVNLNEGSSLVAQAGGDGTAGRIAVNTGSTLALRNNSVISSESAGSGDAGDLQVTAAAGIDVESGSRISSSSRGSGKAGSVGIFTRGDLNLRNGGEVTVSSEGTGDAGDLRVRARNIFLTNQGRIAATTASGEGGNLDLRADEFILLRFNSEITTEARGTGNGGNMRLEAGDFILAVLSENSDIVANAFLGKGGSIFARAKGVFGFRQFRGQRTPLSDFIATSAFGIDGTVTLDIRDFQADSPPLGSPQDVDLDRNCQAARNRSSAESASRGQFFNVGQGGIPANPAQALAQSDTQVPWLRLDSEADAAARPTKIIEAKGWVPLGNGEILLTAQPAQTAAWLSLACQR